MSTTFRAGLEGRLFFSYIFLADQITAADYEDLSFFELKAHVIYSKK